MTTAAAAWCDSLELSTEVRVKLEERVMLDRIERLEISETDLTNLDYMLDGEDEAEQEAALRELLKLAVNVLAQGRRDVTSLFLHNTWWMVSGGLSWGDSPTEAYDLLTAVDATRITERAMALREIKRAHATMADA
ncbi:hypothetical protein [Microbacterium paraoxydans]|uniref:hypothetical protein n=1 Tax=Microbacterium paraoxydans TaxID=199592 RepID=UPI000AC64765|nr:hypothetical protein [Microbacterium paraoxydans]